MWERVRRALVVGLVIAGACSDSDGGRAATSTTEEPAAECEAAAAVLDAYDDLDTPGIFEMSDAEAQAAYAARREAIEVLSARVDDAALRDALDALDDNLAVSDPPQLEALATNHDVVADIGITWAYVVMTSTVASRAEHDAYFDAREGAWPLRQISSMCLDPTLVDEPDQDLVPTVEVGTVVHETFGGVDRGLEAVSTSGGDAVAVRPPDGWDDLDEPYVAPDGRTIVAVARRSDPTPAVGLATGNLNDGFTVAYQSPQGDLTCPRIDDAGRVLVTELGRGGTPNTLLSIAGSTAETVELPVANFYCAERLDEDSLLLGSATDDRNYYGGVTRADGSADDAELYIPTGCGNVITGLSPDHRRELVVQSCSDVTDSGLFVVDTADGESTHLLAWASATARWSPSGEWIVFGLAPSNGPSSANVRLWMMRADGSGLRRVTDVPSSFPAWVSDEVSS